MIEAPSTRLAVTVAIALLLTGRVVHAAANECADKAEHAQDLRRAGRLIAARDELIACGAASCPTVVRHDCLTWLADVDVSLPTVIVRARDEQQNDLLGLRVLVDGEPVKDRQEGIAFAVDPGIRVFRVDANGFIGREERILINEAEKSRFVDVSLQRAPSTEPAGPREGTSAPLAAYATLGVGALGLASFAVLEILAQREYANLADGCAKTHSCAVADVEDVQRKFAMAGVALGVGLVATGVGATWILLSHRPSRNASAVMRVGIAGAQGRLRVDW
jgi:hypothetical protein